MNKNIFEQEYNRFECITREKYSKNRGPVLLDKELLRFLYLLNRENKSDRCLIPNLGAGDLALCAEKADAYSVSIETKEMVEDSGLSEEINVIGADFLNDIIAKKYSSIICFPPMGIRTEQGRSEVAYIKKSLELLTENGRAIILVPQNILTAPAFRELREKIKNEYSLEAVFSLNRISRDTMVQCSIIIVQNRYQNERIFMSLSNENLDMLYEGYKSGQSGFYVMAKEVYDRFDANYYDPEYKEVRELIQKRDTVKLGEIADIYYGCMIPSEERKKHGEYIIIKSQNISGGKLHFDNNTNVFCDTRFVSTNKMGNRCVLKNGDVLISTIGETNWAIYHGEENYAIANQHVAIIRGKQEYEEWLRLFFYTHTGIEALETQLRFLNHGSVFNHISRSGLCDMYVPDVKTMKTAKSLNNEVDLEAKVTSLFRNLGWTVEEGYRKNTVTYDLALLDNQKLEGIVEIKAYKSFQIENNHNIARQLYTLKQNMGEVSLYIFVDDEIYEYVDGVLEQLLELPRPGNMAKKLDKKFDEKKEVLPIKKGSIEESSLSDKVLLEYAIRYENIMASLNRIEGKVDDIAKQIKILSEQILGYQSLVERQLKLAITQAEEERIIHAFSEECTERIISEVGLKNSEKDYNTELNRLVNSFGENAWNKMDESSKTFLVSSKVIFNNLNGLEDIVDYSGVCLLVTKALEVEMSKRFCKNYLSYLKTKYPGKSNYPKFPTALLNQYGKPIKSNHFTLGSVAYVLCYLEADNLTEEQKINNKERLIEYSKDKLLTGKSNDEIMEILHDYADSIEDVRKDYRNPSAHTNELKKVDAEQCFALVVDVEKLMKRILDSFDE